MSIYGYNFTNGATGTVYYFMEKRPQIWACDATGNQRGTDSFIDFTTYAGSANSQVGYYNNNYFGSRKSGQTTSSCYSFYTSYSFANNNASNTVQNVYGWYFDGGGSRTGTINNTYGVYVTNPVAGTNRIATYSDNLSISYTGTSPPNQGAVIAGQVGIGTNSVDTYGQVTINTSTGNAHLIQYQGTMTGVDNFGHMHAVNNIVTLQPFTGTNPYCSAFECNNTFIAPSGVTIPIAACFEANPIFSSNVGTITQAIGLYSNMNSGGAGTITFGYGLYVNQPNVGVANFAGYFNGVVGINTTSSVSLSISNYSNNSGAIQVGGTYSGITTGFQIGVSNQAIYQPATGAQVRANSSTPSFSIPTGVSSNVVANTYINNLFTANGGTISNIYGLFIDTGTSGGGTISNSYAAYVTKPVYGNTRYIGYFGDNSFDSAGYGLQVFSQVTGTYLSNQYLGEFWGIHSPITGTTGTISTLQVNCEPFNNKNITVGYLSGLNINMLMNQTSNIGTVTNAYGLNINWTNGGSGAVTNAYSLYVNQPNYGTNQYCAYFGGPVGVNTTSAQAALIVSSYTNYPYGLQLSGTFTGNDGGSINSLYITSTLQTATGLGDLDGIRNVPQFAVTTAGQTTTNAWGMYINNRIGSNHFGTISNVYGVYINNGTSGSGTITNAYGLYVNNPAYGTNNYCAYFGGNVGIGQTTPTHLLQCGSNDAALPSSTVWISISDQRIKTNIQSLTGALNTICQLQPRTYDYTADYALDYPWDQHTNRVGLIAQEIGEILPQCSVQSVDGCYGGALNYYQNVMQLQNTINNYMNSNTGCCLYETMVALYPDISDQLQSVQSYMSIVSTGCTGMFFSSNPPTYVLPSSPVSISMTGVDSLGYTGCNCEILAHILGADLSSSMPQPIVSNLQKLNTTDITYYLIGAVKELSQQVQSLTAQLQAAGINVKL